MLSFHYKYFILTILFLIIEILIAVWVHDDFIRPYLGDVLVVILIYCFVNSFLDFDTFYTVAFVIAFSFLIEYLQYLNFIEIIGLEHSKIAATVLGNSFAWHDVFAYLAGAVIIIVCETVICKK